MNEFFFLGLPECKLNWVTCKVYMNPEGTEKSYIGAKIEAERIYMQFFC